MHHPFAKTARAIEFSTKLLRVIWRERAAMTACLCSSGEMRTLKRPFVGNKSPDAHFLAEKRAFLTVW